MKPLRLALLVIFLLGLVPVVVSAREPFQLHYPPLTYQSPQVTQMTLPSGMKLFVLEDHELPLIRLSVYVKAGSMYDPEGKEGLAELTARVMRSGGTTQMSGDEVDLHLDRMAAIIEPSISDEYVSWELDIPRKDFDRAWEIFCELLKKPAFAPAKMTTALAVKREELNRIRDYPDRFAFREFQRLFYRGSLRGRLPTPATLDAITRPDVLAFHQRYYFPGNMMIALSGDVDRNRALKLLSATLIPGWDNRPPPPEIPPPQWIPTPTGQCLMKDVPQAVVILGQGAPAKMSDDFYPFEILDFILGGGGFRSYIFQEVRTKRGLSYSAGSVYRSKSDYGLFLAYALTNPDSAPTAFTVMRDILRNAKKGIKDIDIARAKRSLVNSFVFEYTSSHKIARRSLEVAFFGWPEDFWLHYVPRIEHTKSVEVERVARDYLTPDEMLVLVLTAPGKCARLKQLYPHLEELELEK